MKSTTHRHRGQTLHLADKAVFWQETGKLLMADVHLGRCQTLRSHGLYLPEGTDSSDLARITALVDTFAAEEIIILGDLFHASAGMTDDTLTQFEAWLSHLALPVLLIEGNHDRRALKRRIPEGLRVIRKPLEAPPFLLAHEPCEHPRLYPLCGHLHPGLHYRDKAGCALRAKAYWFRETYAIFPAFGATTSLKALDKRPADRVYPCP